MAKLKQQAESFAEGDQILGVDADAVLGLVRVGCGVGVGSERPSKRACGRPPDNRGDVEAIGVGADTKLVADANISPRAASSRRPLRSSNW